MFAPKWRGFYEASLNGAGFNDGGVFLTLAVISENEGDPRPAPPRPATQWQGTGVGLWEHPKHVIQN